VARTSRFVIELDGDERAELERRAHEVTAPWREVQRARIVLYAAQGMRDIDIAARLDCHPEIVSRWRKRFCEQRIEGLKDKPRAGAPAVFPPQQVAEVVAVACEVPTAHDRPLGRFSRTELHRLVIEQDVTDASASTIWRWLHDRSLKPWQQRSWIFPRDPDFQAKAGRVLDLYARRFEGRRLDPGEFVICADEKSQLQALRRHDTVAAGPGRPALVEFEYRRGGTLAHLAARDVHHARLFGRCEEKTGIAPFGPPRRAGHEHRALQVRQDRLLDRRQRQLARRQDVDRQARERLPHRAADPPPDPRLLAEPDSRSTSRTASTPRSELTDGSTSRRG
jgi:transposase